MQIAADSKPLSSEIQEKMKRYRTELLSFGMQEPSKRELDEWHWLFYKPVTEWTAFVINLTGTDDYIEAAYGYASTAFTKMAGDENALAEWGISDTDITIREKIVFCDEAGETMTRHQITQMYEKYLQTSKDELLSAAKEKRRAFIEQIAAKLKPMGFRKKANTWTRTLEGEYYLSFNAQKSSFSDEYYFNVYIGKKGSNRYGDCYYARIFPDNMPAIDWQTLSKDEFEIFLNRIVVPNLELIINTPLYELGKLPMIWTNCSCDRNKCEQCWVEKNRWEAKDTRQ